MLTRHLSICLIVLFASNLSFAATQELTAPVPVEDSYYGWSTATDGQTLVVGAPYENSSLGAAYVYSRNGLDWDYVTTLEPNYVVTQSSPHFGYSVDLDGDTIVVGAYSYDSNSIDDVGAIFIYEKDINDGWEVEPSVITVDNPQEGILFGTSVAIDGDTIVVGATFDDDEKGAAYVYERSGGSWLFDQKLTASDGEGKGGSRGWGDWFGFSVAIDGDIIVAGARQDKIGSNERQGSAYVFTKSGDDWAGSVSKLYNSNGLPVDYYGCSVDVSGEVVVVGAYGESKGKVYVYRYDGQWSLEQQLPQEPQYSTLYPDSSQDFGYDVAIDGDRIVTGASRLSGGYVFMFEWDGVLWSEAIELVPGGGEGYLGRSVAMSGDVIFAGAPFKDGQLQDIGAVHAFNMVNIMLNAFAKSWLSDDPAFDIAPDGGDGIVNLLDFAALTMPSQPLTANAGPDQTHFIAGDNPVFITLDGSGSTGDIVSWLWYWNWDEGGGLEEGWDEISETDFYPGVYNLTLTITDSFGNTASDDIEITIIDTSI